MTIEIGDSVTLKSAILFGLELHLKSRMVGSQFDPGTIEWGREGFGDDEVRRRVISFIEPPKPVEIPPAPQNSQLRTYQWTIFIQGMLPDSLDRPTFFAYEMCADIKSALVELVETPRGATAVSNILNLGPSAQKERNNRNNISNMQIGSETVRGSGEHSRFTYFWLPLYLNITEDLKSPRVITQNPL